VSKNHRTAATKVTAELSIHLKTVSTKKNVRRELHKSNIYGTAAIVNTLITENNAKRRKRWWDDHKTWTSDEWKYVIWSDELSFTLLPTSGRV
jgi:hypothetical protein